MPGIIVGIDGSADFRAGPGVGHAPGGHTACGRHRPRRRLGPGQPVDRQPVVLAQDPQELQKLRQVAEELTEKVTSQLGEARPALCRSASSTASRPRN